MVANGLGHLLYIPSYIGKRKRSEDDAAGEDNNIPHLETEHPGQVTTDNDRNKHPVPIKQEQDDALDILHNNDDDLEQAMKSKQEALEDLKRWLVQTIFDGLVPMRDTVEKYATRLLAAGWESKEMFQAYCGENDINGFDWMLPSHKRILIARC